VSKPSLDIESVSLALLGDIQLELQGAVTSLVGKTRNGLYDGFVGYSGRHVNKAVEAYLLLRKSGRIDASKLLIRPCIESVIMVNAVRAKPESLYQIAFAEHSDDGKLYGPAQRAAGLDFDKKAEERWEHFKKVYGAEYPNHKCVDSKLSVIEAAKAAGIEEFYNIPYRMYCRFTHGSLSATSGDFETDLLDNRTMALCAYGATDAVKLIGGTAPSLDSLRARIAALPT
jgi:hypothetical protein